MAFNTGEFNLTGKNARLLTNKLPLNAIKGDFTLSGQTANFLRHYKLTALKGNFVYSAQTMEFGYFKTLFTSPASFIFTGKNASFLRVIRPVGNGKIFNLGRVFLQREIKFDQLYPFR